MIDVVTRKDFGFIGDKFRGYLVLKDGSPILQLHLYNEFYTVFWLGSVEIGEIEESVIDLIRQISRDLRMPLEKVNTGTAYYSWGNILESTPFALIPQTSQQKQVYQQLRDFINHRNRKYPFSISFAKFEFQTVIPLILWADIVNSYSQDIDRIPEIGFSSVISIPPSILQLLFKTSVAHLTALEVNQIEQKLDVYIRKHRSKRLWYVP